MRILVLLFLFYFCALCTSGHQQWRVATAFHCWRASVQRPAGKQRIATAAQGFAKVHIVFFLFKLLSRFSLTVGFACRFLLPVESHLAAEMDMLQLKKKKKKKSTPQVNCYLENSQCVNDICSNLIHMGNPVIRGGFSRCKSAQKICPICIYPNRWNKKKISFSYKIDHCKFLVKEVLQIFWVKPRVL